MSDERQLHVFEGEEEWYVAYDVDDAWELWSHDTGERREDYDSPGGYWTQCEAEEDLTLYMENGNGYERVTQTMAQWIADCGRGYLGGTNE